MIHGPFGNACYGPENDPTKGCRSMPLGFQWQGYTQHDQGKARSCLSLYQFVNYLKFPNFSKIFNLAKTGAPCNRRGCTIIAVINAIYRQFISIRSSITGFFINVWQSLKFPNFSKIGIWPKVAPPGAPPPHNHRGCSLIAVISTIYR